MLVHVGSVVIATKKHKNSASEKMKNPFGHLHTTLNHINKNAHTKSQFNLFALFALVRPSADRVVRGQAVHGSLEPCS